MQAPSRTRELLIALFVLGALLLTPPLLVVFNQTTRLFGVPILYFYLFVVWAALIALVAFAVERWAASDDLGEADAEMSGGESSQITRAASDA